MLKISRLKHKHMTVSVRLNTTYFFPENELNVILISLKTQIIIIQFVIKFYQSRRKFFECQNLNTRCRIGQSIEGQPGDRKQIKKNKLNFGFLNNRAENMFVKNFVACFRSLTAIQQKMTHFAQTKSRN